MTKAERKAYNCRNRNGIKEFPITGDSMIQIMREMGYKVSMYSEAQELIAEKGWEDCAANNPAFSCKVDGVFTVFVADDATDMTKAITHELGHIEQGHTLDVDKSKEIRLEEDDEANEFVSYFLAPPCFLNSLGIKTLEELEEMLPYGHRLCKEIWANLTAWQQRHNPITYEEECICKMMGVAPQPEPEAEPEPESEEKVDSEPSPKVEPAWETESVQSQPIEKEVEVRYIPQYIPQPDSIPVKTKRFLAGMGVLMVAMLCTIFMLVGQNMGRNQIIPSSISQAEPHTLYQSSQPVENSRTSASQPELQTNSAPASQPELESSSISFSTPAVESSTPAQPESRIVSSVKNEGMLVYTTPSGQKYHKPTCQYVRNKTNIIDMYLSEAQAKGFEPCKVCFGQ